MVDLFHQVCTPMTTPQTPGAFAYGLRLMALDSTLEHQMIASLLDARQAPYQRLLADIRRHRLPERDWRSNPRVVKRKMSKFPENSTKAAAPKALSRNYPHP